jgi:uncharacterized metal-binding protein YceD (DUF177 family)
MEFLDQFRIDLKAVEDVEERHYDVTDEFFAALDTPEVSRGKVAVDLQIRKVAGAFELLFHTEGTVVVACDLCLDDMDQPIDSDNQLLVKLGQENSEDDELIVVDENEGILDTAWFIYEFIALAIPIRHVHAPGKCNAAMTETLKKLSATRSGNGDGTQTMDPRWGKLRELNITD